MAKALEGVQPAPAVLPVGQDYDGEYEEYEGGGIGCYDCDGGWRHTCCDDLCRNCNEAYDCDGGGLPCKLCNPDGEGPW